MMSYTQAAIVTALGGRSCGECVSPPACQINQHVEDHVCVDCVPGKIRNAGDSPSGENTEVSFDFD